MGTQEAVEKALKRHGKKVEDRMLKVAVAKANEKADKPDPKAQKKSPKARALEEERKKNDRAKLIRQQEDKLERRKHAGVVRNDDTTVFVKGLSRELGAIAVRSQFESCGEI